MKAGGQGDAGSVEMSSQVVTADLPGGGASARAGRESFIRQAGRDGYRRDLKNPVRSAAQAVSEIPP